MATHLVLIALGYWTIQQLWVPSKEDRVLVLTLQNTPQDGVRETELPANNTINNADVGKVAKSIAAITPTPTLRSPTPNPISTKKIVSQEPAPRTAQLTQQTATPAPTTEESRFEPPIVSQTSVTSLNTQIQPLLTSLSSVAKLSVYQPSTEPQPVTPAQQKMLEKKINALADNLAQLNEPLSWQTKGQNYVAKLKHLPASGEMDMDQLLIEVSTEQDGSRLTTTMKMKKLAFSNFAQFVHRWDPEVFMHDDEMDGRFHSNSSIHVDFNRHTQPIFHNKVTTASHRVNMPHPAGKASRKKIFRGGLETGVKKIRMPKPSQLFATQADEQNNDTFFFEQNTRIIFRPDGHYLWQNMEQHGPMQQQAIGDQPIYLIGAPGKTIYVSGQLQGKALIYSSRRIVIEGDITYAGATPDSVLGLVSARNIEIAEPKVTGAGDLKIHASIYAGGRFTVRNYRSRPAATLHILGSLTAGSISATEPRYGTKIVFDKRLENIRPPSFPVTNRYELAAAEHAWRSQTLPIAQQTPYILDDESSTDDHQSTASGLNPTTSWQE